MRFWLGAMLGLALTTAARAGECDAQLPAPATLQSAEAVTDYKPVFQRCTGEGGERIAIREMRLNREPVWLLADPQTLATRLERKVCWSNCHDVSEETLASTHMVQAIKTSAEPPPLTHRGFLHNAGFTHSAKGGAYFTADLCPSRKPLDQSFLASLEGETPTPVALSISGLWLVHHFDEYRWLLGEQAGGRLAITWTNHSYSHPFHRGVAEGENFLLSPRVDIDEEILKTEKLLIANGGTPSLFFRFPGLVSSAPLMQMVRKYHLISLGADAWLALNQKPRDGSIILVHVNGNEEKGLKIYQRDAAQGVIPKLKPLDEAP